MRRVAILSVHSHADRSFLDDRILALISGDLRSAGIDNELVCAVLAEHDALEPLIAELAAYDIVVYERVWSARLIEALRAALPHHTFVACEGEHALADAPADYVCRGDLRASVLSLVRYLRREREALPRDVRARTNEGVREGLARLDPAPQSFTPNLHPRWIGAPPRARTFSIEGRSGCPYRADARENTVYTGVDIPNDIGRGCAFCTTGNRSESAPATATAEKVLAQIRYVRARAPELELLVLKDQNPFDYLPELVSRCADEGLSGLSLLLETRADWFLRNDARFVRALVAAERAAIRICPFLVGIESFSQAELDRFNKGTSAELNEHFLARLREWSAHPSLDLTHASFGFVLLTPWTTMDDLRVNLAAVERTGFDRLRGHLLVSRARLYPDTALYYLARRDGLLTEAHDDASDSSRRYGYFPAAPWRFADARVARFAALAAELTERTGGKDQTRLWRALLDAIEADPNAGADDVLRRSSSSDDLRERFARLVEPLSLDRPFADGWRFDALALREGRVRVALVHETEPSVALEIAPRGGERGFARSRHYDLRYGGSALTDAQDRALRAVCAAISSNDR